MFLKLFLGLSSSFSEFSLVNQQNGSQFSSGKLFVIKFARVTHDN